MNSKEFDSLAPGIWLTHAGKIYKISSQQDYDSSYFKITEMEFNPDTEEWQEYRDVNMNKYFLAGWEVYKPYEEES